MWFSLVTGQRDLKIPVATGVFRLLMNAVSIVKGMSL
jgi:hypothetical protein